MKVLLILTLILNLSGLAPVLQNVALADSAPRPATLLHQSKDLKNEMQKLLIRIKHPGSPGLPPGKAAPSDLRLLEAAMAYWRGRVELAIESEQNLPQDRIALMSEYLDRLSQLTALRIAMDLPHGPAWSDAYALSVSRATMELFPGLGALRGNVLGDRRYSITIDRGPDLNADPVRIKLSASHVQGLELADLATRPTDQGLDTITRFLVARQVMQLLADLRYLKKDHRVAIPEVPERLRSRLETLGLAPALAEERHRSVAEPGARAAILAAYEQVKDRFPPFLNDELMQGLSDLIGRNAQERSAVKAPLTSILEESERAKTGDNLHEEVYPSSLPLSSMSRRELIPALKRFIANAKANNPLIQLQAMMGDLTLAPLSAEGNQRLLKLVLARAASYEAALDDALVREWAGRARKISEEVLYDQARSEFVDGLLQAAPRAAERMRGALEGTVIEPSVLVKTVALERSAMQPSLELGGWLAEIASQPTYALAREKYTEIMSAETDPWVVVDGRVSPYNVQAYLKSADHSPRYGFSSKVAAITDRWEERGAKARAEDLRGFAALGERMGFHRPVTDGAPDEELRVTDVLDRAGAERYFALVKEMALDQNPILLTDVTTRKRRGHAKQVPLVEALAALQAVPESRDPAELRARAEALVDQALPRFEATLREHLRKVDKAGFDELGEVANLSVIVALTMKGFPEFRLTQARVLEELGTGSVTEQLMHKYLGNYMLWGCLGIGLVHASKGGVSWLASKAVGRVLQRAVPFFGVLSVGIDAALAGYMRTVLGLFVAESVYQGVDLVDKARKDDLMAGSYTAGLASHAQKEETHSQYTTARNWFWGARAFDVLMMYLPLAHGVATHILDKRLVADYAADRLAFRTLGLEEGSWHLVEPMMEATKAARTRRNLYWVEIHDVKNAPRFVEAIKRAEGMSNAEFAEMEKAFARLHAKIKAVDTYYMPNVAERMLIQKATQTLKLSPKSFETWGKADKPIKELVAEAKRKLDQALDQVIHSAHDLDELKAMERAHGFLQEMLASPWQAWTLLKVPFKPTTLAEGRLIKALGRSPVMNETWAAYDLRHALRRDMDKITAGKPSEARLDETAEEIAERVTLKRNLEKKRRALKGLRRR